MRIGPIPPDIVIPERLPRSGERVGTSMGFAKQYPGGAAAGKEEAHK
jgi:hypothetical protein